MRQVIYFTYHRTDQTDFDWLKVALHSVKKTCVADTIVVTDNMPSVEQDLIRGKYKTQIKKIGRSAWKGRRMLCKLEQLDAIVQSLDDDDELIMADIDLLFLGNPFKAFDDAGPKFGVGLTTRIYKFYTPVNGGMVFFKICKGVRSYVLWAIEQIKNPTWWPYIETRSSRDNVDWNCDQDLLHAVYKNSGIVYDMFGFYVRDVGSRYNYFAGSDVLDDEPAAFLMRRALKTKEYPVLHFKGQYLKQMIREPCMKDYRQ